MDGWKDFERKLKKTIVADKLTGSAAWAKAELMHEERTEAVDKACAKHSTAFDAALTRLIDRRRSERDALARKARARAEASLRKVARR